MTSPETSEFLDAVAIRPMPGTKYTMWRSDMGRSVWTGRSWPLEGIGPWP